jgi:MFS family permease/GNAT superfamily N-acetyltransferase
LTASQTASNAASEPGVDASYRGLFAQPVLRRLAVADVCARLPQGMVSITLLLVAAQHASMTVAGLVVAGYTLGQAATGPVRGRLADRRGLVPVAAICSAAYALALVALLIGSLAAAPAGLLIAIAAVAGLVNPPLSPGMRSLWSTHAGARLAQTAFALDAAVFDLAYITGPVLASGLATGVAPAAAVGVLLALTAAAVITIRAPSRRPADHATPATTADPGNRGSAECRETRSRLGPLRSAALRELLVTAALTNAALSATEVALTAYVRHHHALWASGPLLAEVSIGSILGSLFLGNRGYRLPRLLVGYACGLAVLTAAGLYAPLVAVAAPLAGLCLGPTLATLFGATAAAAPRGNGTETQAWVNSIMNGGAAGGAAVAGLAAGRPILALGLAAAAAAAATLTATLTGTLTATLTGVLTARRDAERALRSVRAKIVTQSPQSGTLAARPSAERWSGVNAWTRERVLDAAAGMEWLPGGAIELCTDDYRLIRYPDVVLDPTFRAAQVTWLRTTRPLDSVIEEIAAHVRGWDLPGVAWWVSAATQPSDTPDALRARDAELIDAVQVLARELGAEPPELSVPGDVVVELVDDERTFRASSAVTVEGWGRAEPDEAELARQLDETLRDLADWSSFRVVALVDGLPVSTGGCTLASDVAQLWGAVTLPSARGRGSYRAVLAERLRLAREHGATLALVKGRVLTSAPTLLRAGFVDYGEERCYWLPVS